MALRVGDVLCEAVEVGHQRHHLCYGLSLLDALNVALIGVLAHRADGDDAFGPGHLEVEVGVLGDGHEFGVTWPS